MQRVSYARYGGALLSLQTFFERTGYRYRRFNYLGEWHSHPMFSTTPSDRDHATMVNIACHGNTGANFVVLMIVRRTDGGELEGSVTVYLPDGAVLDRCAQSVARTKV